MKDEYSVECEDCDHYNIHPVKCEDCWRKQINQEFKDAVEKIDINKISKETNQEQTEIAIGHITFSNLCLDKFKQELLKVLDNSQEVDVKDKGDNNSLPDKVLGETK